MANYDRGWDNVYRGKYHYFLSDGHSLCARHFVLLRHKIGYLTTDRLAEHEQCKICARKLAKRNHARDIAYAIDVAETDIANGHDEPWPPAPGH